MITLQQWAFETKQLPDIYTDVETLNIKHKQSHIEQVHVHSFTRARGSRLQTDAKEGWHGRMRAMLLLCSL